MIGVKLGNYRIVAQIGRGGMGAVYRAEHEVMGRQAAIKVLLPALSNRADVVRRFFNEARASARLQHPALVQVYDCGTHEASGCAYLVMDFLDGESLGRRIERERRLPVDMAIDFTCQTARGMAVAHAAGIIHRDLKPDNLFLVPHPGSPFDDVRILDFGVAKLTEGNLSGANTTKTGALLGTPTYMAPEQSVGAGDVDGRADIYSLGCILFTMICGRPPFAQRHVGALLAAHAAEPPPPPSQFVPDVPAWLEHEILKALAKDPNQRHGSMEELVEALSGSSVAISLGGDGRSRAGAVPRMTEVLPQYQAGQSYPPPPRHQTPYEEPSQPALPSFPRPPSRAASRAAPPSVSRVRGDDMPGSFPGGTRMMPRLEAKAPVGARPNTTLGDSPVEIGPIRESPARGRVVVAAVVAALGMFGIVAVTVWNTSSSSSLEPSLSVPPTRSLGQSVPLSPAELDPPPLAPTHPAPLTLPSDEELADAPPPPSPPPAAAAAPIAAPPRAAPPRKSQRSKKLPFAPLRRERPRPDRPAEEEGAGMERRNGGDREQEIDVDEQGASSAPILQ